ncbi:hypothetical protein [Salipaludibacillus agaradhaerens]|uniref:hypothetical protein n=1 Tax=Salipaludibacillus agaradhaerens TaxID=76935 RepID=UPI000996F083|nr:hypothetical protein [Salipaludibacillus agaradhaerens]
MNLQGDTYVRNESFSEAEHQLIGMKISYEAEEIASEIELLGEEEIERRMLLEYQEVLNDRSIRFVNDVPQYLNTTVEVESYLVEGAPIKELEAGNHINAITKGDPSNPEEIVVVIPGTTFSDFADVEQTFVRTRNRFFNYSEEAIEYVGQLREKYPDAKITVDGHSLAGKIAMQIGMTYPDVEVNAYNPTGLDSEFRKMLKENRHYDNINVLIYDDEIAGIWRSYLYILHDEPGMSMEGLPFNVHQMTVKDLNEMAQTLPDWIHDQNFDKMSRLNLLTKHSNGGFRALNGSLIDVFNLNELSFTRGYLGASDIVFDKGRYLELVSLLRNEFLPNLTKAMSLHEQVEEDAESSLKGVFEQAESELNQINVEIGSYGDPRQGRLNTFKEDYFSQGKYRCYDAGSLEAVMAKNNRVRQKMQQMAMTLEAAAEKFDWEDELIAGKLNKRG